MAKDDGYTKEVANRKHVGARGCDLIVELASRGCTKPTIARALRIGVKTLRACRKRQAGLRLQISRASFFPAGIAG